MHPAGSGRCGAAGPSPGCHRAPLAAVGGACGESRGPRGAAAQPARAARSECPAPWAPSAPAPRTLPTDNFHNSVPSLRGGTVPLGLSRHPAGGARVGPARRRIKPNKSRGCSRADSSDAAERHPQPVTDPNLPVPPCPGTVAGGPNPERQGSPMAAAGKGLVLLLLLQLLREVLGRLCQR